MNKEKIEYKLYEEDLNLEELLKLKKNMEQYDFSNSDMEYVDDLIKEQIDLISDINTIRKLKEKYEQYNYDLTFFDKAIYMSNLLKTKAIENMTKEELEYIYEKEELDILSLLRLYTSMKQYDFDEFDIGCVRDEIKEKIEDLLETDKSISKLKQIKHKSLLYKCDTELIDKYLAMDKKNKKENKRMFKKAAILGLVSGLIDNASSSNEESSSNMDLMTWEEDLVNKQEYEPYHFEEEEMDEDDFYYEDD